MISRQTRGAAIDTNQLRVSDISTHENLADIAVVDSSDAGPPVSSITQRAIIAMNLDPKEWPLQSLDNYQTRTRTQSPLFKQLRRDKLPPKMEKATGDGAPSAIGQRSASGQWKPEPLLATLRAGRAQFCKETAVPEHPHCLELKERLALEQPGSSVRDVLAYGDCYFLAANVGLQELQLAPRTNSNPELEAAGWRDQPAVAGSMRAWLTSRPLNDGDFLCDKLGLAALDVGDGPPFPGLRFSVAKPHTI